MALSWNSAMTAGFVFGWLSRVKNAPDMLDLFIYKAVSHCKEQTFKNQRFEKHSPAQCST